ncbi:hypothetical protein I552_7379 [Mycobacterium xenopi 3993]|nr:hypothetical protein I552_7379 [Mycobacterium xenopi 3993]
MAQGSTQLALADPRSVVAWTAQSAQLTVRRAIALARLIDRADRALDDIAELRRAAQFIADNLADLSKSAKGIDRNSAEIAREITGLTKAAQGIDTQAERLTGEIQSVAQILPTLQRLTEIVDPLDNTVARLGRFVDRLPGGRRTRPWHPIRYPTAEADMTASRLALAMVIAGIVAAGCSSTASPSSPTSAAGITTQWFAATAGKFLVQGAILEKYNEVGRRIAR